MKLIKDCYNDILEWISTNKVRLLITFIIAFIISIILPIWGYTANDAKLSDCIGFTLIFTTALWLLVYIVSQNINELLEFIFGFIAIMVCMIIGIGGLYIAIKMIKFMWYC